MDIPQGFLPDAPTQTEHCKMYASLVRAINNYSGEFSLQHGSTILVFQCSSKLLKVSKCDCLFTLDKATLWIHRSPCRDTYFPCTKATRRDMSQHLYIYTLKLPGWSWKVIPLYTRPTAVYYLVNKVFWFIRGKIERFFYESLQYW